MTQRPSPSDDWIALATEKYLITVYRLAYARTRSRQDAEDVTQEVMLKLIAHASEIKSESHLKAWLIRVTVNQSISLFRSAWRRLTLPLNEQALHDVQSQAHSQLDDALRALSPKLRVVIHLYYYERMSVKEIADALQLHPEAVKSRLHRARKALKIELTEEGRHDDVSGNV